MTDEQLLEEYASTRSESAFRQLVQRHAHWLYSASLRQLGDAQLAEDVTQAAFLALARKAPTLGRLHPGCSGPCATPRPMHSDASRPDNATKQERRPCP